MNTENAPIVDSTVAPATGLPPAVTVPRMADVVSCAMAGVAKATASEIVAVLAARAVRNPVRMMKSPLSWFLPTVNESAGRY